MKFDPSRYDSPDAKVKAVESVASKIRVDGEVIGFTRSACGRSNYNIWYQYNIANFSVSPIFCWESKRGYWIFYQECEQYCGGECEDITLIIVDAVE